MPDHFGSSPTVRNNTAAIEAALEQAGLAEDLAFLAVALEVQGCPCAAEAFWRSSRRRRVQSLLHTTQAAVAQATSSC